MKGIQGDKVYSKTEEHGRRTEWQRVHGTATYRLQEHRLRRVPIDEGYIGSIIDGSYVPDTMPNAGSNGHVDIRYYVRVRLCDLLNRDVLETLMETTTRRNRGSSIVWP